MNTETKTRRIAIMYRVPVAVTVNLDGDPEADAYSDNSAIEDVQVWDTATELNESYFGSRYGMDPDTAEIIRNREMFDKAVELAEEAEWPA